MFEVDLCDETVIVLPRRRMLEVYYYTAAMSWLLTLLPFPPPHRAPPCHREPPTVLMNYNDQVCVIYSHLVYREGPWCV